jgi:hypothetical protein
MEEIEEIVNQVTPAPRLFLLFSYILVVCSFFWILFLARKYKNNLYDMVVGEDGAFQWSEVILFLSVIFFIVSFFAGILGLEIPHAVYATIDITLATGLTGSIYTKNGKSNEK